MIGCFKTPAIKNRAFWDKKYFFMENLFIQDISNSGLKQWNNVKDDVTNFWDIMSNSNFGAETCQCHF